MNRGDDNQTHLQDHVAMSESTVPTTAPLGLARKGFRGRINAIAADHASDLPNGELERRLVELGFTEGASIEVLHEGAIGRDPIAVRVNAATVALRRREAMAILVT
jgi:ferrous iron transport protein A